MSRKNHLYILLLCLTILILSCVLAVENNMVYLSHFKGLPLRTTCVFKLITGIDCPFCGLTRSFIAVSHLQFSQAWYFNRAGVVIYLLVLWQIPYRLYCLAKPETRVSRRVRCLNVMGCCLVAMLLALNWIPRLLGGFMHH